MSVEDQVRKALESFLLPDLKPFFDADADNSQQRVGIGPVRVHFIEASNSNVVDAYLQLFNHPNFTLGTDTPLLSLFIPAGDGVDKDGAMDKVPFFRGLLWTPHLFYSCTTTANGSTDPTIGIVLNMIYEEVES
mgnify:CR=1 FL=1